MIQAETFRIILYQLPCCGQGTSHNTRLFQTLGSPMAVKGKPADLSANHTHTCFWHLKILSVSVAQFFTLFWEVMKLYAKAKSIKLRFKEFDEVKKSPVPDAHEFKSRGDHVSSQVDLITEFIK